MLYYSYTLMFSLILQHCCYSIVCHFVRSLMAFVCPEIKGLLTYLLTEGERTPSVGCMLVAFLLALYILCSFH